MAFGVSRIGIVALLTEMRVFNIGRGSHRICWSVEEPEGGFAFFQIHSALTHNMTQFGNRMCEEVIKVK